MTPVHVVTVGPDADGLVPALEDQGAVVTAVEGIASRDDLESAGILDADLFVLTDLEQATLIPIVKDLRPELRVVVYARSSLPDFVSAQTDIAIDPALLGPHPVAEELIAADQS